MKHGARRWAKLLGTGFAVVTGLVLVAIVLALVFIDSDAVENRVRTTWLPHLSEQLGREVRVGDIELGLLPSPSVELQTISVAGAGEAPPLVEGRSAEVRLRWWPLLSSLGKEVVVSQIVLDEPSLRLVRNRDGTWELTQLLDRFGSSNREVSIESFVVRGGEVRVIDRAAKSGTGRVALSRLDVTANDVGPGLPVSLEWRASLDGSTHDFVGALYLDSLPASFAKLPAEKWPHIEGHLELRSAPVARLESWLPPGASEVLSGGQLDLTAQLETRGGQYVVTGDASGEWLLRGDPAQVSFTLSAAMPKGHPEALTAQIDPLKLQGPGIDATGEVALDASKKRATFAFKGPLLDVDTLLGTLPETPEKEKKTAPGLTADAREAVSQFDLRGRLSFEQLIANRVMVRDLEAEARLSKGTLRVSNATGKFYGGAIDLSGTSIALSEAAPSWKLRARLHDADLANALEQAGGVAAVKGTLGGSLNLAGQGLQLAELQRTLDGSAALGLVNGALGGRNLASQVTEGLQKDLSQLGLGAVASRVPSLKADGGTQLGDVKTSLSVDEGWVRIQSPISFPTPFGEARLTGRFSLERELQLTGTARLSPAFVSTLTSDSFRPGAPIDVPFTVGGTLGDPVVTGVDAEALVSSLARKQLAPKLEDLGKGLLRQVPGF